MNLRKKAATLPTPPPTSIGLRIAELLRRRVLWLIIALCVFLGFIGRAPITTDHERRVAETAATMARSGWPWAATSIVVQPTSGDAGPMSVNPWLVPIFDGQIRLQKPPLPYWCAAVLDRLFGEGPGSARFVPALLGAASTLLVYRLGRRVGGRNVGFVAMLVWTSTHFIVDEYRKAMADPYLACFTLAAVVAWVESGFVGDRRRAGWWTLGFYISLGLACIGKGPPVFLHLAIAIAAFALCFRRWPRASFAWHILGLLAWAAIALPWPIYIVSHVPGAIELWKNELDNDHNPRPFYFYLHSPFLMSLPWVYAWIASVVLAWLRRADRRLLFVHVWLFVTMFVFSFAHMKKNAYLLPVAPAIAIGAAQATVRGIAFARRRLKPRDVTLVAGGHTIAGIAVAGALGAMTLRTSGPAIAAAVGVVAIVVSLLPLTIRAAAHFSAWLRVQAFAFAVLIGLFISFPQADKRERSRPSATTVPALTAPASVAVTRLPGVGVIR